MRAFAVGLPLLLQLAVPGVLVALVAFVRQASRTRPALIFFTGCYIVAIGVAGLWLVLPWWTAWVYGGSLLVAVGRRRSGVSDARTSRATRPMRLGMAVCVLGSAVAVGTTVGALWGRVAPVTTVNVNSPFTRGTYLVVNGGRSSLISAHASTLTGERFRAYRGQSYGVDFVKVNRLGLRANGVLPRDLSAYAIYGEPVVAPCAGRVVAAVDGKPDMPPPETDRSAMAGNHVLLDCDGAWVLLAHFQRGSVVVSTGQHVRVGDRLGRVGNSGNTGEPHLHIHAQRPGTAEFPLSGEPLPIRVRGRYLARNDRLVAG